MMATSIYCLLQIVIFSAVPTFASEQERADDALKTVESKFRSLAMEYDSQFEKWHLANIAAKSEEERKKLAKEQRPNDRLYGLRFLEIAQEDPKAPIALDALNRVLRCSRDSAADAALEQLRRDWVSSSRIAEVILPVTTSMSPSASGLLRDIISKNTDRNAVGPAVLGLAKLLDVYVGLAMTWNEDPEKAKRMEQYYEKRQLDHIVKLDPVTVTKEAEKLYERAMNEFGDVKLSPRARQTIGEYAVARVNRLRSLAPGKPAPEIEGEDTDGQSFKLSDYRGRVVLLVFWASWCVPCRQQVPHELRLLNRFQDKPFALLGVNLDHDEKQMRAAISELGITWRNWRGGNADRIKARYGIQAIPLVLVIDEKGIIRAKEVGVEATLDQTIERLVLEVTASKPQ
jgi:thiol-disulfide isomerase/thioredoxin